jgi:pimeloyl-ACP methyl ester carboxylesterase
MHAVIKYTLWAFLFYAIYCSFLFLLQRKILFPRGLIPAPPSSEMNISGLEKLWIETGYERVEAWFLPPTPDIATKQAPAVIFGHGNGELIDFWLEEFRKLPQLGIGVLLVEYPGYGRSDGSPSQQSITRTFIAAFDVLVKKDDVDADRIILFGRSLGGGAVCALAQNRPSAALILMSTFTSVKAFTARYLAPKFLVRDPFDNLSLVKDYPGPILIIHGHHDEVIQFSHGENLHKAAKNSKLVVYDSGHNDCPPDWHIFWQDVESFLRGADILH